MKKYYICGMFRLKKELSLRNQIKKNNCQEEKCIKDIKLRKKINQDK